MALPFVIADIHGGVSEGAGALRLEPEFLVIEVQVTVAGMFKQRPLTVKVAREAIHSVRYKRGLLRDHLYIRPWKAALLAAVPGKHEGELRLKVKREHRPEAEALVDRVLDWIEQAPAR